MQFEHRKPLTIVGRLLTSFVIIIAFFEVASVVIFSLAQARITAVARQNADSQVGYLAADFENTIQNVQSELETILADTEIRTFAAAGSQYDKSDFYMSLLSQNATLSGICKNVGLVDDIVLYYNNYDKALSAKRGYIPIKKNTFSSLLSSMRRSAQPIHPIDGKFVVGTCYPFDSLYNEDTPELIVAITLSKKEIRHYLSSFSDYDTFLLDNHTGNAISSDSISIRTKAYRPYIAKMNRTFQKKTAYSHKTKRLYVTARYSQFLNCSMVQFVPSTDIMGIPKTFNTCLLLFTVVSMAVLILYAYVSIRTLRQPVSSLLAAFKQVEAGRFDVELHSRHPAQEYELLIDGFNKMTKRLRASIDQLYKQEIYTQRLELKQLQMQINPHFLYNSYFVLHRLIAQEDTESAGLLSTYMGKYFQYITRNAHDKAMLSQEWDHANNYLEIQSIRYANRLCVAVDDLPDDRKNLFVPRLILQPILENAFLHGFKNKISDCVIRLSLIIDVNYLHIRITDNGNALTDEVIERLQRRLLLADNECTQTTALVNIHRRLELEYEKGSGLLLSRDASGGLCVDLIITAIRKKEEQDESV